MNKLNTGVGRKGQEKDKYRKWKITTREDKFSKNKTYKVTKSESVFMWKQLLEVTEQWRHRDEYADDSGWTAVCTLATETSVCHGQPCFCLHLTPGTLGGRTLEISNWKCWHRLWLESSAHPCEDSCTFSLLLTTRPPWHEPLLWLITPLSLQIITAICTFPHVCSCWFTNLWSGSHCQKANLRIPDDEWGYLSQSAVWDRVMTKVTPNGVCATVCARESVSST